MDFRLHPCAPLLLSFWLSLPGLLCCPFIFWQSQYAGIVFLLIWLALSVLLGQAVGRTLRGSARAGQLNVSCGVLFKCTWRLPLRFVTGITRLESPLMHLFHCCTLIIHTSGRVLVLPALSNVEAIQLSALFQREAGA